MRIVINRPTAVLFLKQHFELVDVIFRSGRREYVFRAPRRMSSATIRRHVASALSSVARRRSRKPLPVRFEPSRVG